MKNFEGYLKQKLGDSYVLLAGGGHKAISDFKIGDYLPLAGGNMSGSIKFTSSTTFQNSYNEILNYNGMLHLNVPNNKVAFANMGTNGFVLELDLLNKAVYQKVQNKDGVIALTSDLSSYLPLSGGTVNGQVIINIADTYPLRLRGAATASVLNFMNSSGTWVADFGWLNDSRGNVAYMAGPSCVISADSAAPYWSNDHANFKKYTIYHSGNFAVDNTTLPQRLRSFASGGALSTPDQFMQSGFAYCTGGSPLSSDCNIIGVFHTENGWGHQLCFKFGGTGSTGESHDGRQLWTRIFNASANRFLPWYEILTSATFSQYALPLSGGTVSGTLNVSVGNNYSGNGWCEGIRIYPAGNGWTTIILGCTASAGTEANAYSLHTYGGTFYLTKNGSSSGTTTFKCENNVWQFTTSVYAPAYYTTSDSRKKKEIKQISNSIYQFKLKDQDTLQYGYIAQELEKTNPELVDSSSEYKTVNYNSAICYNISKIENTMKAKIIELEQRLEKLEQAPPQA